MMNQRPSAPQPHNRRGHKLLLTAAALLGAGWASKLFYQNRRMQQAIQSAHGELTAAHHDLAVLQAFTAALHQATGVDDAVNRLMETVATRLGFRRVVVGLVDPDEQVLTDWRSRFRNDLAAESVPSLARLPLRVESGMVATAVLEGRVCRAIDGPCTADDWLNSRFGLHGCQIVPMMWGVQPIGVMLVDVTGQDDRRLPSLTALAQQTAVAIGMMRTRRRRAQAQAAQEERSRIATDLHDTISQSLFGLALTLDGVRKLLPDAPEEVRTELAWAQQTAEAVRQQTRQTIYDNWDNGLTDQRFEADLRRYVGDVLQANHLAVTFDIRGDFSNLSPQSRRNLYRISQECLTNTAHHAAASDARVCVDIYQQSVRLVVRDNGRGFEPSVALSQEYDKEHFGLQGMQERARRLGGTCDIFSQPEAGTSVVVEFPL